MQRRIEEIAANTNDVTNNMRVHIFNDKTDGIIQGEQDPETVNINKLKSQIDYRYFK